MDQPIISNQPTFTQEPVVVPEPVKKPFPKWLLILLIVLILSVTSVFAWQKYQPSQPSKSLFEDQSPSPVANDPIADWKIYTNTKYGFSVKYNSNNEPTEFEGTGQQLDLIGFGMIKNSGFDIEISTGDTLDYYKNRITDHVTENIDKEEKITVAGIVGTKLTFKQVIVIDSFDVSQVIINKNDRDYIITALASDIDLILSTFKFTDINSTPAITDQELQQGWYWGNQTQKKLGTPADWIFSEAGKSSCWHQSGKSCIVNNKFSNLAQLCQEAGGGWLSTYNECEGLVLDADFCQQNNGEFFECLSACRHGESSMICNDVCMQVCQFK